MSESNTFGFAKLVPGFDFLQNLAKGASQGMPQMPTLSSWIAPTLSVEELDKRITELKAVHFWLDQNSKALGATIQALEVQKMTLATLQGMNFSMGELANALKVKTTEAMESGARKVSQAAEAAAGAMSGAAQAARGKDADNKPEEPPAGKAGSAPVDPLQWWGALTQQFQEIAANAMKDVAQKSAADSALTLASGAAKEAVKAATGMAKAAAGMGRGGTSAAKRSPAAAPAKKAAHTTNARKASAKKTAAKKS
jgi:hypothetical protein